MAVAFTIRNHVPPTKRTKLSLDTETRIKPNQASGSAADFQEMQRTKECAEYSRSTTTHLDLIK